MKFYFLIPVFCLFAGYTLADDAVSSTNINTMNEHIAPLSDDDFELKVDSQLLKLGVEWDSMLDWNDKMIKQNKTSVDDPVYVGEEWYDDNSKIYKIWQHSYNNGHNDTVEFEIYTENIYWDKPPKRDFNDYILALIHIYSVKYPTKRGVTVGMKVSDITKAYGKGETEADDEGRVYISYSINKGMLSEKSLVFHVYNGIIKSFKVAMSGPI